MHQCLQRSAAVLSHFLTTWGSHRESQSSHCSQTNLFGFYRKQCSQKRRHVSQGEDNFFDKFRWRPSAHLSVRPSVPIFSKSGWGGSGLNSALQMYFFLATIWSFSWGMPRCSWVSFQLTMPRKFQREAPRRDPEQKLLSCLLLKRSSTNSFVNPL